jgi:hypothetical protein
MSSYSQFYARKDTSIGSLVVQRKKHFYVYETVDYEINNLKCPIIFRDVHLATKYAQELLHEQETR